MRDARPSSIRNSRHEEIGADHVRLVFPPDDLTATPGQPWIEHECIAGDGDPILTASPLHPTHTVSDDGLTVSPSILCTPCGLHGFLNAGVWRDC